MITSGECDASEVVINAQDVDRAAVYVGSPARVMVLTQHQDRGDGGDSFHFDTIRFVSGYLHATGGRARAWVDSGRRFDERCLKRLQDCPLGSLPVRIIS